jgi:hypothetical protein
LGPPRRSEPRFLLVTIGRPCWPAAHRPRAAHRRLGPAAKRFPCRQSSATPASPPPWLQPHQPWLRPCPQARWSRLCRTGSLFPDVAVVREVRYRRVAILNRKGRSPDKDPGPRAQSSSLPIRPAVCLWLCLSGPFVPPPSPLRLRARRSSPGRCPAKHLQ